MQTYIKRIQLLFAETKIIWPLLLVLIRQQLILRYRRTLLGYLWTLINPLVMIFIMGLVFSTLFKQDLFQFTAFIFAGMIPWNFISNVVNQSGYSYVNNESLIKKIYIPKIIFPISIVIVLFIDTLLISVVLIFLIVALGGNISWHILFLPLSLIVIFIFSLGIAFLVSIATVFFRDLQYILGILMQGLFYLTPIIYVKDMIPNSLVIMVSLNPLTPFIDLFRTPISYRNFPSYETCLLATVISLGTLVIGLIYFKREEKKIVFRL